VALETAPPEASWGSGNFELIGTLQAQKKESQNTYRSRQTQDLVGFCTDHGIPGANQKGHNLGTELSKNRNHCIGGR
jgi:hypothetical protein